MCIIFAPRDTLDTHTNKTRTTSVIYSQKTTDYSKKLYQKSAHHNVFFNTEKWDLYPYASPEGAGRMPLIGGDDLWLRNGTLGATMRLKAMSQVPQEITRHPNYTKQSKNKLEPESNNLDPYNYPPISKCAAIFTPTCDVRGRKEMWRARFCPNANTTSPNTTHKTKIHVYTSTDSRRSLHTYHGEKEV